MGGNSHLIRYGLQGLVPKYNHQPTPLTPDSVKDILDIGGSILGSSRGAQNIEVIVDTLQKMDIGIIFMIGGDGTLKASAKIADEITKRKLIISVIWHP